MTRTPLLMMLAAAAALAGCNKENHTIVAGGPDANDAPVSNVPIALPPSITASKTYRCTDNKVVHVDWLSDGKSASIRADQTTSPTLVTAADPAKPMTAAGGYSLSGASSASSVKIGVPGHPTQSCKA